MKLSLPVAVVLVRCPLTGQLVPACCCPLNK